LTPDGYGAHRKHPLRWVRRTDPQSVPFTEGTLRLRLSYKNESVPAFELLFDAFEEGDTVSESKLFGGFTLEIPNQCAQKLRAVEIERVEGPLLMSWSESEIPDLK
jgi:hypothetical protein